jgi:hypothetical protein
MLAGLADKNVKSKMMTPRVSDFKSTQFPSGHGAQYEIALIQSVNCIQCWGCLSEYMYLSFSLVSLSLCGWKMIGYKQIISVVYSMIENRICSRLSKLMSIPTVIEDLQWCHWRTSAILEVFFSLRAGRFTGNNVRKRPKIGHLSWPVETSNQIGASTSRFGRYSFTFM